MADLACGHTQHVRHDPPWQVRPWVLTAESRATRLGTMLTCRPCAERAENAPTPYDDARMCGLCEDGAREVEEGARRRADGAGDEPERAPGA